MPTPRRSADRSSRTTRFATGSCSRAAIAFRRRWPSRRVSKRWCMDKLIERELLATMADKLGFVVSDDEVDDQIGDGTIMRLGGAAVSVPSLQKDGRFNYEAFKTFVRMNLQQTPNAFVEEQKKEMLASRVRNLVRSSVTRLAGRGEGGVHPQEPPGQPRVHPLHQPGPGGGGRPDRRGDRGVRGEERGQAEGDVRAEEVPVREGARPAPHPRNPDQAAARMPTRRPTRRRSAKAEALVEQLQRGAKAPARTP